VLKLFLRVWHFKSHGLNFKINVVSLYDSNIILLDIKILIPIPRYNQFKKKCSIQI